jgi:hypothetical protein
MLANSITTQVFAYTVPRLELSLPNVEVLRKKSSDFYDFKNQKLGSSKRKFPAPPMDVEQFNTKQTYLDNITFCVTNTTDHKGARHGPGLT